MSDYPEDGSQVRPIIQSQQDLEYYKDLAKYQPKLSPADLHQQRRLDVAKHVLGRIVLDPWHKADFKKNAEAAIIQADALLEEWESTGKK